MVYYRLKIMFLFLFRTFLPQKVSHSYSQLATWVAASIKLEGVISLAEYALPPKTWAAELMNSFELPNCCINISSSNFPAEDTK